MKKRVKRTRLNKKKSHSDLLLRNLLLSLLDRGSLKTTDGRAKVLKRYAEKELAYALNVTGDHVENRINKRIGNKRTVTLLLLYRQFMSDQGKKAQGGLITSQLAGFRSGDNARTVRLSIADGEQFRAFVQKKEAKVTKRKPRKPARKVEQAKPEKPASKQAPKKAEPTPRKPLVPEKPEIPQKREGFLAGLRGRLLGRKVSDPSATGRRDRSTARSGI